MRLHGMIGLAAAGVLVAAPAVQEQGFEWRGNIERGNRIEIKGVNGAIRASGSSGGRVVVTAEKKGRRSDPDEVNIEVVEHADGVTICAVYPDDDGKNVCAPGSEGRLGSHDNDVEVTFTVSVPAGVKFVGKTVNGDVEAGGLEADVAANTVNGDVSVSTTGLARANTVNGSIHAAMGRGDWTGDLSFETVNGSVTVELPGNVNADVQAATVNGGMDTDFPLTVTGRFSMKKMRGTIGSGGRELNLKTVNGSIQLKRRG
jgi:hypothetical protein